MTESATEVSLGRLRPAERHPMPGLNYAGITFSFRGPSVLLELMDRAAQSGLLPIPSGSLLQAGREPAEEVAARVDGQLHEATEPGPMPETAHGWGWLNWEWNAGQARVSTLLGRATLVRSGTGYAVEAWLPPEPRAARTLLGALYSAVLHDLGGFILHSASVSSERGVVAFVGPSGAGKSTACRHMHGQPTFSIDRLAVLPGARASATGERTTPLGNHHWYAYPMPGGTSIDPDKPRVLPRWSPLRAILRVRQASGDARLEVCSAAATVALLRESTFHGCLGVSVETEILERLERLAGTLPVGRVHFSLGPSLTPGVSRWLCHQEHAHV